MKRSPSSAAAPRSHRKAKASGVPAEVPRRAGRPSRIEAEQLGERILDAATALFFTGGYGHTTIEAVAKRARISKRTFYHRFDDKPALFGAVIHRTIDRLRPPPQVPLLEGASPDEILQRVAGLILGAALSAPAIALHRLIVAESSRFPKLAAVVTEQGGTDEAIALIAGVLERESRAGRLTLDAPVFAAQQFLHMVISWPQRRAMGLGKPMTAAELDAWACNVVNLFLNGCRGWMPAK
jgi:TetR/AcrR family transcriptional regulator, mexJK operon transcriptional repressor